MSTDVKPITKSIGCVTHSSNSRNGIRLQGD